jgi:hypothetical protein
VGQKIQAQHCEPAADASHGRDLSTPATSMIPWVSMFAGSPVRIRRGRATVSAPLGGDEVRPGSITDTSRDA